MNYFQMRTSFTYQQNLIKGEVLPEHAMTLYAVVEVQIHSFITWH